MWFLIINMFLLLCRLCMHVHNDSVLGLSYKDQERTASEVFSLHEWQCNSQIGSLSP